MPHKNIFSIPAGEPFARVLVSHILSNYNDKMEELPKLTILLPTRRSCRILQDTFLSLSDNKSLLLPRIRALGDINEEDMDFDISFAGPSVKSIKPAINKIKRKILLAKLIYHRDDINQDYKHALKLASALGHFIDQIYTEDLSFDALKNIVPEDFAEHWKITLEFLEIISENWPQILETEDVIDAANRRNQMLKALHETWSKTPPKDPVIIAGTTGSIPNVAKLIGVVLHAKNGQVILPGFDKTLDEESWVNLDETHPQFGFKALFKKIDIQPKDVKILGADDNKIRRARQFLSTQFMRPPETTANWTALKNNKKIQIALKNMSYCACENEYEEAQIIALKMREVIETTNQKAALITPDRKLAKRVHAALEQWGWIIDDSAGQPLDKTSMGQFFLSILDVCIQDLKTSNLLAFLKHPLCKILTTEQVQILELKILRGLKPQKEFQDLYNKADDDVELIKIIQILEMALSPIYEEKNEECSFDALLKAHIEVIEYATGNTGLWSTDLGQSFIEFFQSLYKQIPSFPKTTLQSYKDILSHLMGLESYRHAFDMNERLQILGQLESRLIDADHIILSGLNEGTWPPAPGFDPWMSNAMRKNVGLPSYERSIGLSAHDFVQGFCSKNVLITRAIKSDGAPTIPARWLQRLETVLNASSLDIKNIEDQTYTHWLEEKYKFETPITIQRPEPRPPVDKRPKGLSATKIEIWMKDPYAIYARYILGLKKLDDLEQKIDGAATGSLLHDILYDFVRTHGSKLPENAYAILIDLAKNKIQKQFSSFDDWTFWLSRFENIAKWFVQNEKNLQEKNHKALKLEESGSIELSGFTLSAKIDRINQTPAGLSIIDYKSAGQFSKNKISSGEFPQLPVEALIASQNGFKTGDQTSVTDLSYWVMKGSDAKACDITSVTKDIETIIAHTQFGLEKFVAAFNDIKTPYYALPKPHKELRFNDYKHLSRQKEWSTSASEEAA